MAAQVEQFIIDKFKEANPLIAWDTPLDISIGFLTNNGCNITITALPDNYIYTGSATIPIIFEDPKQ